MLTKLLSRETCAECRLCCEFDRYEVWETPLLSPEVRKKVQALLPDAEFIRMGEESFLFRIREVDENDMFLCPLLDPRRGCMLGTEKPFDCEIWPFRIMELYGRLAITLSPLCDAMTAQPIHVLLDFLKQGPAEMMFDYAQKHPDVVRPYDTFHPILLWRDNNF